MKLITERLTLQELSTEDSQFMFHLMNTPEWKAFIGDRNIHSISDAVNYIQKIIDLPNTNYWVIRQNDSKESIGIVTFMKREYLEHFDIGFALSPHYYGQGFAFEATSSILHEVTKDGTHKKILATTIETNDRSIQLLKRLGFNFQERIERNEEILKIYAKSNV